MRIRLLLMGIVIVVRVTIAPAVLYPVSGDSAGVWNGIDLLPAERNNVDLSAAANNQAPLQSSQANDSLRRAPSSEERPSVPAAPPASAVTAPDASPAAQPIKTHSVKAAAPAASGTRQVSNPKTQPTDQTAATTSGPSQAAVQKLEQEETAAHSSDTSTEAAHGSLIITSVPDSVPIIINDVSVGITPYHATGFLPGLYEITLSREGYEPFRKTVDLKENSTEFVTGTLVRERGNLFVTSVPENAIVFINDTACGVTPFHSKPLAPGIYRLRVELAGYTPYAEQLGISPKLTDTIQVSLVSLKKPGLAERLNLKKSRTIRLISFGATGVVAGAAGLLFNKQTADNLSAEQKAWDNYSVSGKTTAEYSRLYDDYLKSTKKTDKSALTRNICYTIGLIAGVGFCISIPF